MTAAPRSMFTIGCCSLIQLNYLPTLLCILQSQQIFQSLNIPHLIHDADLGVYLKYVGDAGPTSLSLSLSHIFPLEMLS